MFKVVVYRLQILFLIHFVMETRKATTSLIYERVQIV